MAEETSKKLNDKTKKLELENSMKKYESKDIKDERIEMTKIKKDLDLENNFSKKFGKLKKACVLFFYGRFNDAFDIIA